MESQLLPSKTNLQPQNNAIQQGRSGLQQTGGVDSTDATSTFLSQPPTTSQLQVQDQGQAVEAARVNAGSADVSLALWLLLFSVVLIVTGFIIQRLSAKPQPKTVIPDQDPVQKVTTPAKSSKPKKKQSRKKRAAKR